MNQMSPPLSVKGRRDEGMARVGSKVDRLCPGWTAQAEALLSRFLRLHIGDGFITEEFGEWAEAMGLPEPHDSRAYGPLIVRAAKLGWVAKGGFKTDRWSSPKTFWLVLR